MNSYQLDGKGPRLLVTHSAELVSGSVWPMAVHQEMTPAVHSARILQGRHVALGSVHTVYFTAATHKKLEAARACPFHFFFKIFYCNYLVNKLSGYMYVNAKSTKCTSHQRHRANRFNPMVKIHFSCTLQYHVIFLHI